MSGVCRCGIGVLLLGQLLGQFKKYNLRLVPKAFSNRISAHNKTRNPDKQSGHIKRQLPCSLRFCEMRKSLYRGVRIASVGRTGNLEHLAVWVVLALWGLSEHR